MYTLKYKNTYAPLIMQKTKLPTLQGQPLSLKKYANENNLAFLRFVLLTTV